MKSSFDELLPGFSEPLLSEQRSSSESPPRSLSLTSSSESSPRQEGIELEPLSPQRRIHRQRPADNLSLLIAKLHTISERYYAKLWAENGLFWALLKDKSQLKAEFEQLFPELALFNRESSPAKQLAELSLFFLDSMVDGENIDLTNTHLNLRGVPQSELNPLSIMLRQILDNLSHLLKESVEAGSSTLLDNEQLDAIRLHFTAECESQPKKSTVNAFKSCLKKLMQSLDENQLRQFFGEMLTRYDHERLRLQVTTQAITLDPGEGQGIVYETLTKLYNEVVDDHYIFDNAYGPSNKATQSPLDKRSSGQTPYQTCNKILTSVFDKGSASQKKAGALKKRPWKALIEHNHNAISFCYSTQQAISNLDDIYYSLEALNGSAILLSSKLEEEIDLLDDWTRFYNHSYDEIYCYHYFTGKNQERLARYMGIDLTPEGMLYNTFIDEVAIQSIANYDRKVAEVIRQFLSQHKAPDDESPYSDFMADLTKEITQALNDTTVADYEQKLTLIIQQYTIKTGDPNEGEPDPDLIAELANKITRAVIQPPIPEYKRKFAEIIRQFTQEDKDPIQDPLRKISHQEFHAEIKKLSSHFRPKSLLVRIGQYLKAALTGKRGNFAALQEQYKEIKRLEQRILPGFKEKRHLSNAKTADSSVKAKLDAKLASDEPKKEKDKLADLHWLYLQEKGRINKITQSDLCQSLEHKETRSQLESATHKAAKQVNNAVYPRALSKLHFLAQNTTKTRPEGKLTVSSLKAQESDFESLVTDLLNSDEVLAATTQTAKVKLKSFIESTRDWELKTQVRMHLVDEGVAMGSPVAVM